MSHDPGPCILSLPHARGTSIHTLCDAIVASRIACTDPGSRVRVELDVAAGHVADADAASLHELLDGVIASAIAATAVPSAGDGTPRLREVVVTSVESSDAIEVEVADSGPAAAAFRPVAIWREQARRCGGEVSMVECPEGGVAITLRLPRHGRHRQAA